MRPRPPTDRRRLSPWPHVIWLGVVVIPVTIVLAAAAGTDQPAGQCSGIGFGCTVSGGDLAVLVAYFVVPPAFVVLLIGHLVIWATQCWRRP